MRKFNWDEFKEGKFAVHCKTEEEEVDFCKQMHEHGMKYKILEWSDYMQKKFTKSDLKDGMVVKHRNGDKRMVISEALIGENGYADQNCFREDLTHRYFKDLDIVGVYAIQEYNNFADMLSDYNLELIWERKEPKKMTVEEMREKLEELTGEEIEVTA